MSDNRTLIGADGQQRLQSFYIGLHGSFGGKKMFFDLYSDFQKGEYIADCLWYPAGELYDKLSASGGNSDGIADEIIFAQGVTEPHKEPN